MNIFPAIDLLEGKAVHLNKGHRDQATVYSDEPLSLIEEFSQTGVKRIHIVDLDGAFSGKGGHHELVAKMVEKSSVPIQLGGGIRDRAALDAVFELGVQFAVLGTAAVKSPRIVRKACRDYPGRIIVAVDAVGEGSVSISGWVEETAMNPLELATRAVLWGAAGLLYTDISRDGSELGPNVQATAALSGAVDIPVTASGGVSTLKDLELLAASDIDSVVIGHAIYEKNFTLAQAFEAVGAIAAG